jgi:hypothetical protein
MSDSIDKIKGYIAKALAFSRVSFSSNGKQAGRVVKAVATSNGVVFYIDVEHLNQGLLSKSSGNVSIEIPLYNILAPGQSRICPSENGYYRATLSDGKTIDAWYDARKGQWQTGEEIIGEMHEIFVKDWPFPAIVVGIEKLGDVDPTQTRLIEVIEKIMEEGIEETKQSSEL